MLNPFERKREVMGLQWVVYAFLSAFFAGITAVYAKMGMEKIPSHLATALRTIVVLLFTWLLVFLKGQQAALSSLSFRTFFFLFLSGLSTGASWLFYFKAIQKGEVYKVAAVDKCSIVLTVLLAALFLQESLTIWKGIGVLLIFFGTFGMMKKQEIQDMETGRGWLFYAVLSVIFASLTAILGKIGIAEVPSDLGTAVRTIFVLLMAWLIVLLTGELKAIRKLDKNSAVFLTVSGMGTGLSWICYYKALQMGPASLVAPIDKLSLLVTALLAYFLLKEKPSKKALFGLAMILTGTLVMLIQ